MKVCTPITIRYAETDMMGVVYHANYLLYFEDSRTDFLEKIGYPYKRIEDAGYISPVVSVDIQYGMPLRYGDTAIIRTWISESRPTKTTYSYEVFKDREALENSRPLCTGKSVHCLVDAKTFKPQSIKKVCPELYKLYEELCEN